ncbi:MAG: sulfatase-like hydrolase/transferase [Elusimicrobia bacterium]|nr:sulfatase-like hydrolase/transferase [Elusimicrobiota bacterium]
MIDVCISTHDNLPELPAVLDSILPQRDVLGGAVRMVDNGSMDGGPDWVRRNRPWVEVIELGSNRGPGASRNAALRGSGTPWVLLLDGDCSLAAGCVEALLRDREEHPAEVYSARMVYAGNPGLIYYDAGQAHCLGLMCLENVQVSSRSAVPPKRDPGAVSTSAFLVAKEAARSAGLFDEDYFFFGEDLDFSLRLRASGGRLRHVPEAVVLHHKPLPGSAQAGGERFRRTDLRSRRQGPNRWRTLLKVCGAWTLLRTAPLQLLYGACETVNALREGAVWQHLRGVLGFWADLPRVLRERRRVQATRRVDDRELFADTPLPWRSEVMAVPGAGLLRRALERACGLFWAAALAMLLGAARPAAAEPGRCPDCSLVVIGLDDVRADRVAARGGGPGPALRLDRFAQDAVVFTQAVSPAPWTLPAFISLFTSLHPSRHGVVNRYSDFSAEPPVPASLAKSCPAARTLAQVLRGRGLRTAAFTGGAGVTGSYGLAAGFEVYEDSSTFGGFGRSVPKALSWLDSLKSGERFFLFVHGYDAHPFNPEHFSEKEAADFRRRRDDGFDKKPRPAGRAERRKLIWLYDEAMARLDRNLAPLLDRLDRPDLRGRVLVAVVGDHGEELFEHGGVDHGLTLYDEVLRVPLLLRLPGAPARRVDFQVRTLDLMPTLLDLLGAAPDPALAAQMEGVSLLPALRGEAMELDAFSETDYLLHSFLRSLRTSDGWKAIHDRSSLATRLFRLAQDTGEKKDLAEAEPVRLRSLEERLLTTGDPEPLAAGTRGTVKGRWKTVREGERTWSFDLWQDPLRARPGRPEREASGLWPR